MSVVLETNETSRPFVGSGAFSVVAQTDQRSHNDGGESRSQPWYSTLLSLVKADCNTFPSECWKMEGYVDGCARVYGVRALYGCAGPRVRPVSVKLPRLF